MNESKARYAAERESNSWVSSRFQFSFHSKFPWRVKKKGVFVFSTWFYFLPKSTINIFGVLTRRTRLKNNSIRLKCLGWKEDSVGCCSSSVSEVPVVQGFGVAPLPPHPPTPPPYDRQALKCNVYLSPTSNSAVVSQYHRLFQNYLLPSCFIWCNISYEMFLSGDYNPVV